MVIFLLWDDRSWQKLISKRGPSVFFSEAWTWNWMTHEGKLGLALAFSLYLLLTNLWRHKRYWNDYASGFCRYPDVYLMIKRTRRMDLAFFFYPFALSLFFFLSYLYIFISPCMARTGHWQGMKAEVLGRVCSLSGKSKSLGWRKR